MKTDPTYLMNIEHNLSLIDRVFHVSFIEDYEMISVHVENGEKKEMLTTFVSWLPDSLKKQERVAGDGLDADFDSIRWAKREASNLTKRNSHGGKRREGRTQTMKSFRIDKDLIEKMEGMDNKNAFVNEAIREKLGKG